MFKRITAVFTTVCLIGLGVIGLSTSASATGGDGVDEHQVCFGTPIHHEATGHYKRGPIITPATDGHPETFTTVPGNWWNWSPNNSQGAQDYTPAWPTDSRGTWQGGADGHVNGGPDRTAEGTFNESSGASGNSSWFHRGPSTQVSNHDYVAPTDAKYGDDVWVVDHEAYDEPVVIQCPSDAPVVIQWPTPQVNDACGAGNATWVLPTGDNRISWTITDDGRLIGEITAAGFVWPSHLLVNSWGQAAETNTEACAPTVIAYPFPSVTDECGADNAEWVLPADGGHVSWIITDDGRLIGTTDEGYTWPSGNRVNSWGDANTLETNTEPCLVTPPTFAVPDLFANPPTCEEAGTFDVPDSAVQNEWNSNAYLLDDGKVTLLVDRSDAGLVHLYVFSTDNETVLTGLSDEWDINADGRSALHTIVLAPATGYQFTDEDALCYATPAIPVVPATPVTPVTPVTPLEAEVLAAETTESAGFYSEVLAAEDPASAELAQTGSNGVAITLGAALVLVFSGLGLTVFRRRATR
ncbi:hypothetical protein [Cellulomonas sp. P5_E12]